MNKLYRIYTEDINRKDIIELVSTNFPAFTAFPAYGYWKGVPENSLVIEIITDGTDQERHLIHLLAEQIKFLNKQEGVLIIEQAVVSELV